MSGRIHTKDEFMMTDGRVADAVSDHWVDTLLPNWFRPYARLSRLERPIGWWLLLWPCLWSLTLAVSTHEPHMLPSVWEILWYGFAFWLGAVAMRGAGCTYNDIVDQRIDGKVERTRSRPLPSKQITRRGAFIWLGLQALIGLFVLMQFNSYTILLGFASLSVVAIYPFMKRVHTLAAARSGACLLLGRTRRLDVDHRLTGDCAGHDVCRKCGLDHRV